jgi:hypothetical protein
MQDKINEISTAWRMPTHVMAGIIMNDDTMEDRLNTTVATCFVMYLHMMKGMSVDDTKAFLDEGPNTPEANKLMDEFYMMTKILLLKAESEKSLNKNHSH